MNEYEIPEVVEIDRAKNAILGEKEPGRFDIDTGSEVTQVNLSTDIDE